MNITPKYILILFLFVTAGFLPAYAKANNESIVGISLDKKSCGDNNSGFIPLPLLRDDNELRRSLVLEQVSSMLDEKAGSDCKIDGLFLGGYITKKSFPTLKMAFQLLEQRRNNETLQNKLWIDSEGGLVIEAMKIGDFIASKKVQTIIPIDSKCYSSCVYIIAASETRMLLGNVGIHRPFASEISTTEISYSEYLKEYDNVSILMRNYLSKYGVSPTLVDQMNVVASDENKILSMQELKSVGLWHRNIAAQEFEKARTIELCGQEYYDMHRKFHGLIDSCREELGIYSWDEKDEECWKLARLKFPNYSEEFNKCKAKKSNSANQSFKRDGE